MAEKDKLWEKQKHKEQNLQKLRKREDLQPRKLHL